MSLYFPTVLAILLLWNTALFGEAQVPQKSFDVPASALRIQAMPGLMLVGTNTYRCEAGLVDTLRMPRLEKTFTLSNSGTQPLLVTGLRGSCGCETLLLQKDGISLSATRLNPGESATAHLVIQLHSGQSGPARKYMWVDGPEVGGQRTLLATLELDLTLRQSAQFVPSILNFGVVEAGTGAAQELVLSLDADLLVGQELPPLQSTDPEVQVRAVGPHKSLVVDGKEVMQQSYRVVLSPSAHAGAVSGNVHFAASILAGVSASLTGSVSGALDAMPSTVFFGSLQSGKSATRIVVLTLSTPTLTDLHISTDAPWLQATLDSSGPAAKHRLIKVTLTARAPIGLVQRKVKIALPDGETLDIAVVAELTK